jgi:hypothetical protein
MKVEDSVLLTPSLVFFLHNGPDARLTHQKLRFVQNHDVSVIQRFEAKKERKKKHEVTFLDLMTSGCQSSLSCKPLL